MAYIELKDVYKVFGRSPTKMMPLIREGITKDALLLEHNHTLALNKVNLSIERGEIFVIMGLSGSGKSTLIRHLNRLIEPTSGEIWVDGKEVLSLNRKNLLEFRRYEVSMVFQKFGLLPHRTVIENSAYGLKIRGISKPERRKSARQWINAVGLDGYEDAFPGALSGGMQQRVGLARALATNPKVLIMDEPFSALDPLIRREMQDVLLKLQKELQKTIVFITHDLDEAMRIAGRIAMIRDGNIVQVGTPEQIQNAPANDYVAEFVKHYKRPTTPN